MDWIKESLGEAKVIPSIASVESLKHIVEQTTFPCIMLKMGSINNLAKIVAYIHQHGKHVMLHLDSVKGIAKDKSGMQYLKKIGVDMVITMKSQHIRMIKEAEMGAVLGCFLVDSSSVQLSIQNIKNNHPDIVITMPITVPDDVIREMKKASNIPIIAGGLGMTKEIIDHALSLNIDACAVTDWNVLKEYQ